MPCRRRATCATSPAPRRTCSPRSVHSCAPLAPHRAACLLSVFRRNASQHWYRRQPAQPSARQEAARAQPPACSHCAAAHVVSPASSRSTVSFSHPTPLGTPAPASRVPRCHVPLMVYYHVHMSPHVVGRCARRLWGHVPHCHVSFTQCVPPPQGTLNAFMASGRPAWVAARQQLQRLLSASEGELRDNAALRSRVIHSQVCAPPDVAVSRNCRTDLCSSLQVQDHQRFPCVQTSAWHGAAEPDMACLMLHAEQAHADLLLSELLSCPVRQPPTACRTGRCDHAAARRHR